MPWLKSLEICEQHWQTVIICASLFGVIQCFAGYAAWPLVLGLYGLGLGFFAGGALAVLVHDPGGAILIASLSGAVVGLLLVGIQWAGTFLYSATVFAALAARIAVDARWSTLSAVALACAAAIAGAVIVWLSGRDGMIVASSIGGAVLLANTAGYLLTLEQHGPVHFRWHFSPGQILFVGGLAIAGMIIQFMSASEQQDEPAPTETPPQVQ